MLLSSGQSAERRLFSVCHQVSGRTRLRVPALMRSPSLATSVAATLRGLEGVQEVRVNAACGSLTLRHPSVSVLSERQISQAVEGVLVQVSGPPRKRSERVRRLAASQPAGPPTRAREQGTAPCAICRLKLKAMRWLLSDLWRCWRDAWVTRLRDRRVWISTMLG